MNKLVKFISIIMLIFLIICQYTVISNAAQEDSQDESTNSTVVTLKADKSELVPGDEVKVYISLNKIGLEDGVSVLEAKFDWETDVLEPLITNGTKYNDWTIAWNQENGKIEVDRVDNTKDVQEVAEITFRVKDDIDLNEVTSTEIKLTKITINNEEDLDTSADATIKFSIVEKSQDGEKDKDDKGDQNKDDQNKDDKDDQNKDEDDKDDSSKDDEEKDQKPSNNDNGNNGNNNGNNSSDKKDKADVDTVVKVDGGNSNGQTQAKDESLKNGNIPYTGVTEWAILAVIVAIILGYVSYKKYQKYKGI